MCRQQGDGELLRISAVCADAGGRSAEAERCLWLQAIRPGVHKAKDGSFRATFEDKPLLSDIVFLRAWVAVDLPRFYNPVTNLLAPAPRSHRAPKPSKVLPACSHLVQCD